MLRFIVLKFAWCLENLNYSKFISCSLQCPWIVCSFINVPIEIWLCICACGVGSGDSHYISQAALMALLCATGLGYWKCVCWKLLNLFVQTKKVYLSKLSNVFVQVELHRPLWWLYCVQLVLDIENVIIQIVKSICLICQMYICTIYITQAAWWLYCVQLASDIETEISVR